jgi:hypothetical protein
MPTQTLFLLDDLEDIGRTSEVAESDLKALRASRTGSTPSWSSLTRISVALGPSVPSCLCHWNARHFGSLRSRSPTGTFRKSSSL